MPVSVVTDSGASIPPDLLAERHIDVVPFHVNDGTSHRADTEIDLDAFYNRLEDMTTLPTSSQPSVDAFLCAFRRVLQRGSDIAGIFVSAKESGTYETACLAAEMVRGEFPERRIELLDSATNSMAEGFGVLAAAQVAVAGETVERCIATARDMLRRTRFLFTPRTLEYLRRGGRIGGATALIGGLLQIRPILTMERGEAQAFAKVRTQSRALAEIAHKFTDDIAAYGLAKVIVHYIADKDLADAFAREHIEPLAGGPVRVLPVSPVIGLHTGPAVGVVYATQREWT